MEFDRLLDLLAAHHSFRARLRSDEPMQIWSDSGWVSANTPVSGGDIHRMLALAATPEVRAFVQQPNTRYEFDFPHISGIYRVHVEDANGRLTVFILRLDQSLPSAGVIQKEPNTNTFPNSSELTATITIPPESDSSVLPTRTVVVDPSEALQIEPNLLGSHTDDELHWFYGHAGQSMGPHTFEQMAALIASGALPADTIVFDSRVGDWQEARNSELKRCYEAQNQPSRDQSSDKEEQDSLQDDRDTLKSTGRVLISVGLVLVVLLGGWSRLNQIRESNSNYDYSTEFAEKIVSESPTGVTGSLHNVRLQRSFSLPSHYFGTAQYSDGYLADIRFDVESRDFFERPAKTDYEAIQHNFAGELETQAMERMNTRLTTLNTSYRVDNVSLTREIDNNYSGTVHFDDDTTYPVAIEIQEFDLEGNISKWDYKATKN